MYKSYRAYTGRYPSSRETVDVVIGEINERREEIVSVTAVGEGQNYVLIITKEYESMVGVA
jgi:hypothetical protein